MAYDCRSVPATNKGKDKCISYANILTDLFHLEVESDNTDIHPPKFCNSCYSTIQRMRKSARDGRVYRTSMCGLPTVRMAARHVIWLIKGKWEGDLGIS